MYQHVYFILHVVRCGRRSQFRTGKEYEVRCRDGVVRCSVMARCPMYEFAVRTEDDGLHKRLLGDPINLLSKLLAG